MKIKFLILLIIPMISFSQSQDQNYISTKTYREPNQGNPIESIQYFDGLGRPIQSIVKGQATEGKDIITHTEYDAFGRQIKEFLPYVNGNGSLNFRADAAQGTLNFYGQEFSDSQGFSEKIIENSPLNRVIAQGAPGADWNVHNGHPVRFEYHANSANDKVVQIKVNLDATYKPTYSVLGYYADNTLYKNIVFDENGNKSEEYKNVKGQVILKRNFAVSSNVFQPHDTYYVYDDFDNLTLVIPPKVTVLPNQNLSQDTLLGLCYQYHYNDKNLLVSKILPGKREQFLHYDSMDRLKGSYAFYNPFGEITGGYIMNYYDNFNRITHTAYKQGNYVESYAPAERDILTKSYYDNYNFVTNISNFSLPTTILNQNVNGAVKGQATGSFTKFINKDNRPSTTGTTNVILYDNKYRPIANYSFFENNGYINTQHLLDFSGKILETHTFFKENPNSSLITIKEVFTYNAQDQLVVATHQINNGEIVTLNTNTYNDLGQVILKNVAGLENTVYKYNIRGWLTQVNDVNNLGNNLFSYKIHYNSHDTDIHNNEAIALYNGNISAIEWKAATDNVLRNYSYKYDQINRLTQAYYKNSIELNENFNEGLTYDKSGNILTLNRYGLVDALSNNNQSELIDELIYTPMNSFSNRLRDVKDISGNAEGFNRGDVNTSVNLLYTYDAEGNLIKDEAKKITAIAYNYLNLPTSVTFTNGSKIEYVYNADGVKLYKKVYQDPALPPIVTTYRKGFQYVDGVLKFFPHAEGYVNVTDNGNFEYIYNYLDHLGNVRVSYKYDETATETNNIAIVDANNYYPFGLKHKGYGSPNENPDYKYKYNGKELQDELGLNWHDYGARNYDAALGRWMNVDPLAEQTMEPYSYVSNNPIRFIDPTGMAKDDIVKINVDTGNVNIETKDGDDIIQFVDDNGNKKDEYKYGDNGSFKKDFKHNETTIGDIPINELITNNFKQGDKLFDKIAQNSNMEWEYMTISLNDQYVSTVIGNTGRYFNDGLSVGYASHYFLNDMSNIYSTVGMKINSHEHNHPKYKNGLIADWPSSYYKKSRSVNEFATKGDGVFAGRLKENTQIVDPKINFFIRPQGANYKVKYDGIHPYTHVK